MEMKAVVVAACFAIGVIALFTFIAFIVIWCTHPWKPKHPCTSCRCCVGYKGLYLRCDADSDGMDGSPGFCSITRGTLKCFVNHEEMVS